MKLIRDRTPDLLRGSTRPVRDTEEHEILLRAKLMEEAAEVASSTSKEELTIEMGDLFEALITLAKMHNISLDDIRDAMTEKMGRKGSFTNGIVLLHDPLSNKTGVTL